MARGPRFDLGGELPLLPPPRVPSWEVVPGQLPGVLWSDSDHDKDDTQGNKNTLTAGTHQALTAARLCAEPRLVRSQPTIILEAGATAGAPTAQAGFKSLNNLRLSTQWT